MCNPHVENGPYVSQHLWTPHVPHPECPSTPFLQLQIPRTLKTQSHIISSRKISLGLTRRDLAFSELCPYVIYGPCFLYQGHWFLSCVWAVRVLLHEWLTSRASPQVGAQYANVSWMNEWVSELLTLYGTKPIFKLSLFSLLFLFLSLIKTDNASSPPWFPRLQ